MALNMASMAALAVLITLCLTFYIVACAKNTVDGESSPNYTLLVSLVFIFSFLTTGAAGMKAGNGMLGDWLNFMTGMGLASTFAFPVVLYMVSTISTLAFVLAECGNVALIASCFGFAWYSARSDSAY